jgi:hypothetical protein
VNAIVAVCWMVTIVAFIDAIRRPASDWASADRNRAFWLVMLVFLNAIAAVCYALFIVPRFSRAAANIDSAFLKR